MATVDVSATDVGYAIEKQMMDQGVSIKEISQAIGITYEHARRIVRGEAIPSRYLLGEISKILLMDLETLERLAKSDKLKKKFPDASAIVGGRKPGMEPIERVWDSLTTEQKADLIQLANSWASRNS